MEDIVKIQRELKAPKGQYNSFGRYHYRSAEDIIEALKPVIHPMGYWLICEDTVEAIGGRVYVHAMVTITNGDKSYTASSYAREDEIKKGMDGSQITGAASSYARKYALNGLLAIDDSKDSDVTNKETKPVEKETLDQMHPKWVDAVKFIKGGGNIDAIKAKYEISESDENELRKA